MSRFVEVRRHSNGRTTLAPVDEHAPEALESTKDRVLDKILTIREHDHQSLYPLVGRQVYLSPLEFAALKETGLLRDQEHPYKMMGYEIITDEDLK
jgi:hypothetical protein